MNYYNNGGYYPPQGNWGPNQYPYKKPVNTALAVILWILFWPVGIVLIWKTAMSGVVKWIFTILTVFLAIFCISSVLSDPSTGTAERLHESTQELHESTQELQQSVQELKDKLGIEDSEDSSNTADPAIEEPVEVDYVPVTIEDLRTELENNAFRAQQAYLNQCIEFSGTLDTIDSSGFYFTLKALSAGEWDFFETVRCVPASLEHLDVITAHNTGDVLTVKGKVITVDEVVGYEVWVHEVG